MTLTTVPDVERLVSDYLRTHADIAALSTRIVGKSPSDKTTSWVRVSVLDDPQVNQPDHLVRALVQFDCYAGEPGTTMGGQPGANLLARTVRAVLGTLSGASHSQGVVTSVDILGGPRDLDADIEPARDKRIVNAYVYAHA